jgi:hypothetical protein
MAHPLPELTGEPIDPSVVVVASPRPSRAPESLPPHDLIDVLAIARDVSEDYQAEGLHVRVEHGGGNTCVPGVFGDLRRVLRWMIERSSDIEGGTPWVALRVFAEEGVVGYELPWFGTARAATGEVESALFDEAVAELGASFQVSGLRARLELPRAWGVRAPLVSGIRPRVMDEGADARTEPPPRP